MELRGRINTLQEKKSIALFHKEKYLRCHTLKRPTQWVYREATAGRPHHHRVQRQMALRRQCRDPSIFFYTYSIDHWQGTIPNEYFLTIPGDQWCSVGCCRSGNSIIHRFSGLVDFAFENHSSSNRNEYEYCWIHHQSLWVTSLTASVRNDRRLRLQRRSTERVRLEFERRDDTEFFANPSSR